MLIPLQDVSLLIIYSKWTMHDVIDYSDFQNYFKVLMTSSYEVGVESESCMFRVESESY